MSPNNFTEPCRTCVFLGNGVCEDERCRCNPGFVGPACTDRVTTARSQSATTSSSGDIYGIVAGVLAGVLLAIIVGLTVYFYMRRRLKKNSTSFTLRSSNRTTLTTIPGSDTIVVPALYNVSSTGEYCSTVSSDTISYHLYEEL